MRRWLVDDLASLLTFFTSSGPASSSLPHRFKVRAPSTDEVAAAHSPAASLRVDISRRVQDGSYVRYGSPRAGGVLEEAAPRRLLHDHVWNWAEIQPAACYPMTEAYPGDAIVRNRASLPSDRPCSVLRAASPKSEVFHITLRH
ncbi:hypothetical protein BD626DRAFT_528827 [Schizophyllum amplum]|uniref:Uncharacterized protein n=1 Tax=Schizophyllum amplum TaxID=97359 RepID=A0A550BS10_9AGAR|nr:hypothetical protein BD626DRAFT_528827 [Auriculariopsis ampla]